jgi:hypothetical protein
MLEAAGMAQQRWPYGGTQLGWFGVLHMTGGVIGGPPGIPGPDGGGVEAPGGVVSSEANWKVRIDVVLDP